MEKYFVRREQSTSEISAESGEKGEKKIANVGYYEENGRIVARDLQILIDDKLYSLEVGTKAYVNSLAKLDPPLEEDYKTLIMEDVTELEDVYNKLRKLSKKELLPHLHLQEKEINTSKKSKQILPITDFLNPENPRKKISNEDEF